MSQSVPGTSRGRPGSADGRPFEAAVEARVRQLIATDEREALQQAKDLHRTHRTAATEALLIDAYLARIQALERRDLRVEAQALSDLVRQRHPSARTRLAALEGRTEPRARTLDEILRPLSDQGLGAERRADIERTVRCEIPDLEAIARCEALPPDHALRVAASALDRAFVAVTSGPVDEATLALPEVSHRSPLAPWKRLVRAIASFHRDDDAACRQHLEGIDPESVPARAIPALRAMLDGEAARPAGAAAILVARISGNPAALRSALRTLDEALASENERRIVKAVRAAVQECQRSAPSLLESVRQHVMVRVMVLGLHPTRIEDALGGSPVEPSATYLQLLARGLEEAGDLGRVAPACLTWQAFRRHAVREGWFAPNAPEAALIYLHTAELLDRFPPEVLRELQRSAPTAFRPVASQLGIDPNDQSFLHPEQLYQRASILDQESDAFARWMAWALRRSPAEADRVADAWHKARPRDLRPILHLMHAAAARDQYPAALRHLREAERVDGVHPDVRSAKARLLVGSARRHLQDAKIGAAEADLAELSALPLAPHDGRAAALAALRWMVADARGASEAANAARAEVERLLGGPVAAVLVRAALSAAGATTTRSWRKRRSGYVLPDLGTLAADDRIQLPVAVAMVAPLLTELQIAWTMPAPWMAETAKQFGARAGAFDLDQLQALGTAALASGDVALAFAVSAAGLDRGDTVAAQFLLLRARALSGFDPARGGGRSLAVASVLGRRDVCAAAAAALARERREMEVVEAAVDAAGGAASLVLTADQAVEVLAEERAHATWPTARQPGPDYGHLIGPEQCQCPACRRARLESRDPFGDIDDPWDDDLLDEEEALDDLFDLPPDVPSEIAEVVVDEMRQAMKRGESPEQFLERMLGSAGPPRRKRRKGKRR